MSSPTPLIGNENSSLPAPPGEHAATALSRRVKWGLAAATAAGCVYVAVLDPNTRTIMPPCPFRMLTGLDCPGCGMTRAMHSLLHGDLVGALDHNVLLIASMAVALVWFAVRSIRARMGHPPEPFRITAPVAITLGVVVCAFWVLRNIPFEPFHWLNATRS